MEGEREATYGRTFSLSVSHVPDYFASHGEGRRKRDGLTNGGDFYMLLFEWRTRSALHERTIL